MFKSQLHDGEVEVMILAKEKLWCFHHARIIRCHQE